MSSKVVELLSLLFLGFVSLQCVGKANDFGGTQPGPIIRTNLLKCATFSSQRTIGTVSCASCTSSPSLSVDEVKSMQHMSFVHVFNGGYKDTANSLDAYIDAVSSAQRVSNIAFFSGNGNHTNTGETFFGGYEHPVFDGAGNLFEFQAFITNGGTRQSATTSDFSSTAEIVVCCGTSDYDYSSCAPSWVSTP